MKKVILGLLSLMLVMSIVMSGCAKPEPAPTPAPAPSPAPTPGPASTPTPTPAPAPELPVPGMKLGEEDLYFEWTFGRGPVSRPPLPPFTKGTWENWFGEIEQRT